MSRRVVGHPLRSSTPASGEAIVSRVRDRADVSHASFTLKNSSVSNGAGEGGRGLTWMTRVDRP